MKAPLHLLTAGLAATFLACEKSNAPLTIYTSFDPAIADRLVQEFEKESKITVEYVRLSTGEALTRIRTEKKNPKASAWMGGPGIEYAVAAHEGLLEPYKPKLDHEIHEKYRDKNWAWHGLYIGTVAFASNKKFLEMKKTASPKSWQDLLRPEFKGNVAYAYPYTSGTAMTILLGLVQLMGEDHSFEYLKKLDHQVRQYSKSGSACVNQAGLGEIAVCICFAHDILSKGIDKGYPLELTYPSEGTSYEATGVALIKGGPEPEKAEKLIDWLNSESGQTVLETWHATPLNPKVQVHPPTAPLNKLKLVDFNIDWAVQNEKRLVEKWRKVTGK